MTSPISQKSKNLLWSHITGDDFVGKKFNFFSNLSVMQVTSAKKFM